jgi:peptidylprolyl isomerase
VKNVVLAIGAITLILVVVGVFSFTKGDSQQNQATQDVNLESQNSTPAPLATESATLNPIAMNNDLVIEDIKVGTGDEAVAGKKVTVNYKGTLTNGTQFDSSYDRGTPFTFNLGAGEVIQGWDNGVKGMKVGGKRKLTIPSQLGYGERGAGNLIPPNATLIFEVELLKVE